MAISVLILTLKPAKAKHTARQNPDLIMREPASHDT
jgi:hypothetical protein